MRNSHTVPQCSRHLVFCCLLDPLGSCSLSFIPCLCFSLPFVLNSLEANLTPFHLWPQAVGGGLGNHFPQKISLLLGCRPVRISWATVRREKKNFWRIFFLIFSALVSNHKMIFSSLAYNLAKIGCSFFCRQAACSWHTSQKPVIFQFLFPKPGGTKRKVTKFLEAWGKEELIFFQISY